MMNVTDRAISNYESGIRLPDFETIKVIRKLLNIPVEELLEVEAMKNTNPFFTKEDFIRFCATWEYDDNGCDFDKDMFKEEGNIPIYTVFQENPYQFRLIDGQILWYRSDWNTQFIEDFQRILRDLTDKKVYNEPTVFEVIYYLDDDEFHKKQIKGYDNDTQTDIFILTNLHSILEGEGSLVNSFGLEYKEIC